MHLLLFPKRNVHRINPARSKHNSLHELPLDIPKRKRQRNPANKLLPEQKHKQPDIRATNPIPGRVDKQLGRDRLLRLFRDVLQGIFQNNLQPQKRQGGQNNRLRQLSHHGHVLCSLQPHVLSTYNYLWK